jgi:PDZ domain-containing protein
MSTDSSRHNGSVRRLYVALPLLTLSWLILLVIVVASLVRIERWELAPGEALTVGPRIEFVAGDEEPPTRYEPRNGIHFVTAFGGKLSALDSFVGWLDPDVQVDTFTERFGNQTPSSQRVLNQQAMISSKQIAEYVALKRLGYNVELIMGPAIVADLICEEDPHPKSACEVLDVGDTITEFNGTAIEVLPDLLALTGALSPGDEVEIKVQPYSSDVVDTRTVRVIANPSDPTKTIIGFVPVDTRTVELPFEVGIATSDIGGPSAGLAFTLAILDELTEGNLMGRGKVAATGTINDNEDVGAVGAVRQKAVAVRDAGATLFLIPASQSQKVIDEAREAAGKGVTVVPVATLQDALDALRGNGGDALPEREPS